MSRGDSGERQSALATGAIAAAVVTLVLWFGCLAFLRWVPGQGVRTGLGPEFLYAVVLPIAMAGLAWAAGSAAFCYQIGLWDDDQRRPAPRQDDEKRARIVAPLAALVVNWVVWNASLDRFDWLSVFTSDLRTPSTLVVLIVFPLLLVGLTIWSGLAVRALIVSPVRQGRTDDAPWSEATDD